MVAVILQGTNAIGSGDYMKSKSAFSALSVMVTLIAAAQAQTAPEKTIPVTVDNFIRAESDLYFSAVALKEGGFGKFEHHREVSPIDDQNVIRQNRDTLYSAAVFDLDAGPVTITLPDAGKRFMSMQLISEDEYTPPAIYGAGPHTITKEKIGTRYVLVGVRTLVDPSRPGRHRQGARAAGCDQGRAAGRSGQVRSAKVGPGEPEESSRGPARARHNGDRHQ